MGIADLTYCLSPDVVIEPLVDRWHAWPHLVSPTTSALNTKYRHLPLLESFIADPSVHAHACKTPSLRGGPFVDLPITEIDKVKSFILKTKETQEKQILFAEAIRETLRLLIKEADGFSIERFYENLPDNIRGYVELTYSLGNSPSLRIIEPLVYCSDLNTKRYQTSIMFQSFDDNRPFIFSTPRLPGNNIVELPFSFNEQIYDYLAKLRNYPSSFSEIVDRLQIDSNQIDLLNTLLVEKKCQIANYQKPTCKIRWRYFGHACVLIETEDGKSVLIDPVISYAQHGGIKRFILADLPDHVDYVILTHNHADHVMIETLLALRYKIGALIIPNGGGGIADPSLRLMLQSIGFNNVIACDSLDTVQCGSLQITAFPFLGEHGDLEIYTKAAWLVRFQEKSFLFAADSNNLDPQMYDHLRNYFGPIENVFLGMECQGAPLSWTYGPYLPISIDRKKDQSRRLNGSDSLRGMKLIHSLGCKNVFIYAMGSEPWLQFLTSIDPDENTVPKVNARELIENCKASNIQAKLLYAYAEVVYE